jgi:hypothetical protein
VEHPKDVGDRTVLGVMLVLQSRGFSLLLPFGENTRYDLGIDDGGRLMRVQCKTGKLQAGAVRFKACSTYAHHPHPKALKRDYEGEIDYFAVYCRDTGGVYLIPFADVPVKRQGALRVAPARNGQRRLIRLASDYEVGRVEIA